MILSTSVTSKLHFEMCAGLYGHYLFIKNLFIQKTLNCSNNDVVSEKTTRYRKAVENCMHWRNVMLPS